MTLPSLIMLLQKKEQVLLVKLFYQNGSNNLAVLCELLLFKRLQKMDHIEEQFEYDYKI